MAELYQVATGSKKISNLASISGISGSAVIPVVMSNTVGSTYPITNGTTHQISYEDFRESVIENNANVFTQPQIVQIGSGNSQQRTALVGFEFTMITGSGIGDVTTVAEGLKLEVFGQGTNAGVKLFSFDNTDVTPANRFKTFMEVGTGNSNLTLTRNVITTGNLNVAGNLGLGGNLNINQNLVVGGTITAQSYNTEFISASIIYESGSTKFGDDTNDTHERTGSLLVTGSSSVIGNSYVSGIVQNTLLGVVTSSLINQNISQNDVNLLISAQTASQGLVNTLTFAVTSSLINTVGGLQAYTASLKSAAIVSSSQQILNYNIFATTGSNTFRADQVITGSLSISAGEFNVTTGSGNMTSSLIFDHTQNDGVTLGLRHNDRLSFADHTFNVNVWAAGVYTTFVRNGTPYSILNVEAFDDNKIYLYRDTRLYNKSLTIDKELLVKQNAKITGSFNVTSGSGFLTSSIEFIHDTISPSQGSSTFEVRHINSQYSENFAVKLFADDYIAKMQYEKNGLTYDILRTNLAGDLHLTRDTRLFGTGLTVDDSLLVKGVITGSILATNGVVSSSNQLVELNTFTGSLSTSATNINSFTASQISVNALTQAVTSSLITQNTSQGLVNALTQAVTSSLITIVGGLQAYTASLKSVGIVSSSNQLFELNNQTGSQNSINTLTQAVTSSLLTTISGVQSYTASLKGAAIVSSSQQIQNYNLFAVTSSGNIFYGENTFTNKVTHTNGFVILQQVSQSLNFADDAGAAAAGVPLGGLYRNGNFIAIRID